MTERLLTEAFALQRFAPNARLQAVIEASHRRTASRELSDDELEWVAAAGAPEQAEKPEEPKQ